MTQKTWATSNIAIIGNGKSFTFLINGESFTISDSHPNFKMAVAAREAKDLDGLLQALKPITIVERAASSLGKIRLEGDKVFAGTRELRGVIIDRIMEFKREGVDFKYLLNFLDRLQANPSKTAQDELYLFLESSKAKMPITEDGCFLAYKKVNRNYKDLHSGTVDYSIGKVVEMPRNQVDDDRNRTCSAGLHFCSLDYLKHFHGGDNPIVIVKIDPADVVAIPNDYNNAKGRTWRMEVLGLHKGDQVTPAWNSGFVRTETQRPEYNPNAFRNALVAKLDIDTPSKVGMGTPTPSTRLTVQPAGQTAESPGWRYFRSRELARAYANKANRVFKDFGYASNTGYRWAVAK